ncbi:MAG: hypothetical protein OEY14_02830, partial [Myxococcales bacterium]|nr:hypothetical protein [Myxococcales bacterium]
ARFCEGEEYAASTLRWYSSRLGRAGQEEGEADEDGADASRGGGAIAMVRLGRLGGSEGIVVELGDARVRVPKGVDGETLREVLGAVLDVVGAT